MKLLVIVFTATLIMKNLKILGPIHCESDVYNVLDYGATICGHADSSQAFLKTWNAACKAEAGTPKVVVPENVTFLVFPTTFHGPCRTDRIMFLVSGTIVAPDSPSFWTGIDPSNWLVFSGIKGLILEGHGNIDGRGNGWWNQSCKLNPKMENCTKLAPTTLRFLGCNESKVSNIHLTNSPQTHIYIGKSHTFRIDKITIKSPGNSPNTDGIHIQSTHKLSITKSNIATGDDCISVGDYTSDVKIGNIRCGPGHGISIGSLGKGGNFVQVSEICVSDSIFDGTTNGARIKTWQVGKGYATNITFRNLQFINVRNPIVIDQNYCEIRGACEEKETGVKISNVSYVRMLGTSSSSVAINLNCSRSVPCSGILMKDIRLASAIAGKEVRASCTGARGQEFNVVPGPCLALSTCT